MSSEAWLPPWSLLCLSIQVNKLPMKVKSLQCSHSNFTWFFWCGNPEKSCKLEEFQYVLWPLLPSVGLGSVSGAAFWCEGWWAWGPFSYYAARGLFGVGPSAFELCSLLKDNLPNFTSLWSPASLVVTGLGAPPSCSFLKRRYISP